MKQQSLKQTKIGLVVVVVVVFLILVALSTSRRGPANASQIWKNAVSAGRFQHIADEHDDGGTVGGHLNDVRLELRRLKQPLKALIAQLEDPKTKKSNASAEKASGSTAADANIAPAPALMFDMKYNPRWNRDRSIFVAMVGRVSDKQPSTCMEALDTLFERASTPDQVTVGVVEVYDDSVDLAKLQPLGGCVNPKYQLCNQTPFCATDQIRVRRVNARSIGSHSALALATAMFRGETYTMLLGSNAALPPQWDTEMLVQHKHLGLKALLTAVPVASGDKKRLCKAVISSESIVLSAEVTTYDGESKAPRPYQIPFASTGLMFGGSAFLRQVPLDPSIVSCPVGLYDMLLSARLFSSGVTFFNLPPSMHPTTVAIADTPFAVDTTSHNYVRDVLNGVKVSEGAFALRQRDKFLQSLGITNFKDAATIDRCQSA